MVVIDASIVYKWLVEEAPLLLMRSASALLQQHFSKEEDFIAPSLLLYELGNTITYKVSSPTRQAVWRKYNRLSLPVIEIDTSFMEKTVQFAGKHHVSVYDASYAVLAEKKGCDLITADKKFVTQTNLPYVRYLGDLKA